jgi:hypothetical protein
LTLERCHMAYASKEKESVNKKGYYLKNSEKLKEYQRQFRQRDDYGEKHAVHTKRYRDKLKKQVFDHYGNQCACCGEAEETFLTIDHINGGGNQHRKQISNGSLSGGNQTYLWLIRNNFPDGFQVLCMNCNWGRAHNNGVCPHNT